MEFMHVTLVRKVTKGQINNGSISQNEFHMVNNVCAKFHPFIKKCTIQSFSMSIYAALLLVLENFRLYSTDQCQCSLSLLI